MSRLTLTPPMVDQASSNSCCYDGTICQKAREGKSGETLFFELTVEDLIQTPDLLHLLHEANEGVDGWVSLEVLLSLVDDTVGTVAEFASSNALKLKHHGSASTLTQDYHPHWDVPA